MPGLVSSLRSIGSSLGAIGKSGLIGPFSPAQVARTVPALLGATADFGGAYHVAAALDPEGTAAVDDAGVASFAEMDRRAGVVAAGLGDLGVGAGDVVGVLCRNHRGFLLAVVAAARLGADTVYLNTGSSGPELAGVAASEGIGTLVVDDEFLPLTASLDAAVVVVVGWCEDEAGVAGRPTLQSLLAGGAGRVPPAAGRKGRQVLLTSGTTGTPKGAARSGSGDLAPAVGMLARIPYRRRDVTVLAAPMFHAWGLANTAIAIGMGATLVLPRRFDPEDVLRRIEAYRARVLVAVPVMLQRIMELPAEVRARYDTSSLRVVALSGSALPGDLALRFMDSFGDVVHNLYGSTEVGWVSVASPADLRAAPATAGRVLPGVEVEVVDEAGARVPAGAAGRIVVRSSLAFDGYTGGGRPDAVAGFLSTGDLGHVDRAGRLFVDGRGDDMVVSGGENVFPREVEDLIAGHPAVAEVSVAGVPDERMGQRLEAWVVVRDGHEVAAGELTALVRDRLARHKVPRRVHFVPRLPRTPTGKVVTRDLARGS